MGSICSTAVEHTIMIKIHGFKSDQVLGFFLSSFFINLSCCESLKLIPLGDTLLSIEMLISCAA